MSKKIIASRTLYWVDDKNKKIVLEVFEPQKSPDTELWDCEVRVDGASDDLKYMKAGGVDSYQALTVGLSLLQAMVNRYNRDLGMKLRFQDDASQDLLLRVLQE